MNAHRPDRVRRTWIALTLVLALGLGACGGDDEPGAEEPAGDTGNGDAASAVAIRGFLFKPSTLEVSAGTEVVWTNEDETEHTVTSGTPGMKDGKFEKALSAAGVTFPFTFADPGTYPYFCERHISMVGEVIVS